LRAVQSRAVWWLPFTLMERAVLLLVEVSTVASTVRARYTFLGFVCLAAMLARHGFHVFRVSARAELDGALTARVRCSARRACARDGWTGCCGLRWC
jgi:hypothetical protein